MRVVAAENFWGSIAAPARRATAATVTSIITNPGQDPHSYEPTRPTRGRWPRAQLAIVNGVGYDPWTPKLLAANPEAGRIVLDVGDLFGLKDGDNPHRWYDPADVRPWRTRSPPTSQKLDPKHASLLRQPPRRVRDRRTWRPTTALIAADPPALRGAPVGASESIFALQAPALGLRADHARPAS